MDHFIVSARKYRPSTFKDVVGQQAITNTLENAIANDHLAQALLFTGPRGVGKTTCARILAKRINQAASGAPADPDEDYAFNIFELDAASNNSVDDIRNLIDQVRIPPQTGNYKVYIIDEVHMLSASAFNAFLKTLEEPPKHAIFILATTEKHKIIPTILSRCQIFDFKRITVKDIRDHLMDIAKREGVDAEEEALHIIAQKADGALRDALSTFDRVVSFTGNNLTRKAVTENLNVLDYDTYFEVTDLLLSSDIPQLLLKFNDIISHGFDAHHFIAGLASHFRDLMVCKNPATLELLEVGDQTKKDYQRQAQQTEMSFLLTALEIANDCDLKYRTSRNPRLLVELCLMQLASISKTVDGEKKKLEPFIISPDHFKERKPAETLRENTTAEDKQQDYAENSSASPPKGGHSAKVSEEKQPNYLDNVSASAKVSEEKQTEQEHQIPASPPNGGHSAKAPQEQNMQAQPLVTTKETSPKEEPVTPNAASAPKTILPEISINTGAYASAYSRKGFEKKKEILQKKSEQVTDESLLPREPFTEIALQAVWKEYVNRLQKRGEKILASNMEVDTPTLKGTEIHLEFPNNTMKVELERAQGGLLEYLKRKLNNYDISLVIDVNEQAESKFAFTPREKYEKMRAMNPDLELLLKTFDLEL